MRSREYSKLREQLYDKTTVVQSNLIRIVNNDFEKFMNNSILGLHGKIVLILETLSQGIVILSLFTFMLVILYRQMDFSSVTGNTMGYFIITLVGICIVCLWGVGIGEIGAKLIDRLIMFFYGNESFKPDELVKEKGVYRCRICNHTSEQYRNSWFSYCEHLSGSNLIKQAFISRYWIYDSEIIIDLNNECGET